MSNRIDLVQGTTKKLSIDLVADGRPVAPEVLLGASAEFLLRNQPTDSGHVLRYTTALNPANLAFVPGTGVLDLTFLPNDTSALALQLYFYQVQVTLAAGDILPVIEWDLLDLNLGGAAVEAPAPFATTVKIDHDYPLADAMAYFSPGGSPIPAAQVRIYRQSDYASGNLAAPVGITLTTAAGKWANPVLVLPGYSYVAVFAKEGEFGPDALPFFV